VSDWIIQTEAMLNGALRAAEIYGDYSSGDALQILKSWVVGRVSGLVRMAYAAAGGDGTNVDGKDLVDKFDELLEDIRDRASYYGAMLAGGSAPDESVRLRASNRDGAIEPTFTHEEKW
jgi:hypothetical protein